MILRRFLPWAAITALFLTGMPASWASTVPDNLLYEGRILDREGQPVTSAIVLRFSLWKSTDYVSGDASGGSINTGASNYGGWQEAQTISPGSTGVLHAELGSSTALPTLNAELHKYLQVEVKYSGQPDTSYVLLDPTADNGADTEDRKFIGSVAFAKNAGSLGSRTIGTASGNILILGPGGRIDDAQMGDGTTASEFGINAGNAAGDATLTFGNALLPETLTFSAANARFEFSDDVFVGGALTASGSISTDGGLTLNAHNAPLDATLTFGNDVTPETLAFSHENGRFEFSDDLRVQGNLTVTGTINGVSLADLGSTPLTVSPGAGLTVQVSSGSYRLGNAITNFGGDSAIPVAPNATSYVFFGSGGIAVRQSGFPTHESFIPLATVITSGSDVTSIADSRALLSDTREHETKATLAAEFDKAAYLGDGSANVGMLSTVHDAASKRNFYLWTSTQDTVQDYDIYVRYQLPKGFTKWKRDGGLWPLAVYYRTTSANASDNALDVSAYDTSGAPVTLTGTATNLASATWAQAQIGLPDGATWTGGQELLLKFTVKAKSGFQVHLGSVELVYVEL